MFLQRYLGLLRGLLIVVGVGLFLAGLDAVASMPTPPPESDGFIEGLTYIFGLLFGVGGLLLVQVEYAIPPGSGRFGPLADRNPGIRGGVVIVGYLAVAIGMVYVVPLLAPTVTGSTTYALALFVLGIAAVVGSPIALVLAAGDLLHRVVRT